MENYKKSKSSDRHYLPMEMDKDEINETYQFCNFIIKKHINRLHAEINKPIILIAFTITVLLAIVLLFGYGYIVFIIFAIPVFVTFAQQKKANHFNKTMIK